MIKATQKNKAEAIRSYQAEHPDKGPTEVAAALKKNGYKDVTPQYVSTIKSMDKRKSAGGSKRGPVSAEDIMAAKEFACLVGGSKRAQEALTMLERLQS